MMVRPLVAAMIALGLGACGKQLNPEYCASHPNDTDCRGADLVMIDAPLGCMSSAMCTMDPTKLVCEVATGNCVQCTPGGDTSACTTATGTVCGEDRLCHGCLVDTHCTLSAVCLPTGDCADESAVLYASPAGTGNCTRTAPCTFTQALTMLSATKTIIKLTTTQGTDYSDPPIVIAKSATIIGTGTTFTPTGAGAAITVTAGTVEIMGITVTGATDGMSCTGGSLTVRRASLTANSGYGLRSLGCDVTVERTRVRLNQAGGLYLDTGTFEVRNDIVDHNGNGGLVTGNVFLNKAKGRLVFNTIANNLSGNGGGDKTGGIKCAGSGMFKVAHNIIVANGGASSQFVGDCQYGTTNYASSSVDAVKFAGTTDYHLTANSPTANPIIRDDPDADADCKINGAYIDDFDGQARPYQLCDRGADEYRP